MASDPRPRTGAEPMAALDLLRARFPESEGWTYHSVSRHEEIEVPNCFAFARCVTGPPSAPFTCVIQAWGDTEEVAATALISAWDAATHAEKVRDLVKFVEEAAEPDCFYGDGCPPFGSRHGKCNGCKARDALAALPEHWKEGVRG